MYRSLWLGVVAVSVAWSASVNAQETLSIGFAEDTSQPSDPRWVVCYRWDRQNDFKYVSNIRTSTVSELSGNPDFTWADFIVKNYDVSDNLWGGCNVEESAKDAQWRYNLFMRNDPKFPKTIVPVTWSGPLLESRKAQASNSKTQAKKQSESAEASNKETAAEARRKADEARLAAREKREAEFQAKLAAHEAQVAEYQRKVKAREAEIARQNAAHAAAQEKARQAQQAHQQKMTMFERVLEEQKLRHREYEAALERNKRCTAGDQQACADIKAGKPALEEQLASKEEPKTSDDDARTCVTEPVVSASKTWKGALQAVAFNGCKSAVDVRICLLRTGGWNCGMVNGLKPQDRWTWWSYETQGEIFWDARVAGSNEPLANPGSD